MKQNVIYFFFFSWTEHSERKKKHTHITHGYLVIQSINTKCKSQAMELTEEKKTISMWKKRERKKHTHNNTNNKKHRNTRNETEQTNERMWMKYKEMNNMMKQHYGYCNNKFRQWSL